MYRHFIIRRLKNYADFCGVKNARQSEIKLLTVAFLNSEGERKAEIEKALNEKTEIYMQNEKERKRMEIHLSRLSDEDRQILTDFYIKRDRQRYSKYYCLYGKDYEQVKGRAMDNLISTYRKGRKIKRHS